MDIFVARQPIFDSNKEVVAYELLYRNSRVNSFSGIDGHTATSSIISNSLFLMGLDTLTQNKRAFINFTLSHLRDKTHKLFNTESLVVEILEDIDPDQELLELCKSLKAEGFTIALDDFTSKCITKYRDFYPYIDIIKVDFMQNSAWEWVEIVKNLRQYKISFLAEKVEKESEFVDAKSVGYSLFQGYFFSKPIIVDGKDIPASKITQFQLLNELARPEPDIAVLSSIAEQDLSISYKILRIINSAAFHRSSEIKSIKQALVLMGLKELQKWLSFVIIKDMGSNEPQELIWLVLIRAKFGESIARLSKYASRDSEIFLMGLFSCIDVFINRPISEIISKLPLADDIKGALTGKDTEIGKILKAIIAYEKGEWDVCHALIDEIKVEKQVLTDTYIEALNWANQIRLDMGGASK
jgi:EAL and modified HD-GYP domain-containing signal transduction protein